MKEGLENDEDDIFEGDDVVLGVNQEDGLNKKKRTRIPLRQYKRH